MINFTSQERSGLKHLSLLRKVITQRKTGSIHFQLLSEEIITVDFYKGDMIGSSDCPGSDCPIVDNLRKVLTSSIWRFAWVECPQEARPGPMMPEIALSSAITNLPLDAKRVNLYKEAFIKLPDLTLKHKPIHRYSFGDETEYQHLYQLSLRTPTFRAASFFGNFSSEDVVLRQVRAMLLAFLLGHLVPVGNTAKSVNAGGSNAVFASRIMKWFRG